MEDILEEFVTRGGDICQKVLYENAQVIIRRQLPFRKVKTIAFLSIHFQSHISWRKRINSVPIQMRQRLQIQMNVKKLLLN